MKFSILALPAILALAAAAETTTADASTTTLSPEAECAKRCDAKDICCTAKCFKVPCPSDDQANDTNECVAACPQGTGTPADAQKYAECEQSCYTSHFWGGSGNAPTATQPTVSAATGSTTTQSSSGSSTTDSKSSDNNDKDSKDNGSDGSSSAPASATTSSFSQQTDNAAANVKLGASAAGLFGLVVAAFAL